MTQHLLTDFPSIDPNLGMIFNAPASSTHVIVKVGLEIDSIAKVLDIHIERCVHYFDISQSTRLRRY